MTARVIVRRALPAAVATGAVVALLAGVRARPPAIDAQRRAAPRHAAKAPMVSSRPATKPGPVRTATETETTPFSVISVRVTLTGGQLTRVETVALSGANARTEAINARAEPILREEALHAGLRGRIDVVSGATYTSQSYEHALQAAIDRARG